LDLDAEADLKRSAKDANFAKSGPESPQTCFLGTVQQRRPFSIGSVRGGALSEDPKAGEAKSWRAKSFSLPAFPFDLLTIKNGSSKLNL
jgi:hypothetical protein